MGYPQKYMAITNFSMGKHDWVEHFLTQNLVTPLSRVIHKFPHYWGKIKLLIGAVHMLHHIILGLSAPPPLSSKIMFWSTFPTPLFVLMML